MKNVILDVDTGVDDAIAIIMAIKSKELNVVGITTVNGNVMAKQAAINTERVIRLINGEGIPVVSGSEESIDGKRYTNSKVVHGNDGLFEALSSMPYKLRYNDKEAVDFLIDNILAYKDQGVTLILTAPLTNIALAFKKAPYITKYIREAIIMGGANKCLGNITPYAEFNLYRDPEAVDVVLKSKIPTTLITLDVTNKVILTEESINRIEDSNLRLFISKITKPWMSRYERKHGIRGCIMHDPLTVAYAIDPNIIKTKKYKIHVVNDQSENRGQILCLEDELSWLNVSTEVNAEVFDELFLKYVKT